MIPITLTPEERLAYDNGTLSVLVRVAEECPKCGGSGDSLREGTSPALGIACRACKGTGYAPCPLGEQGDVLEDNSRFCAGYALDIEEGYEVYNCLAISLTRTDAPRRVRLVVHYYHRHDPFESYWVVRDQNGERLGFGSFDSQEQAFQRLKEVYGSREPVVWVGGVK